MTKKYKIIISIVASVMVLVIAGLAVGLVLVAQQVQMSNSVSVTYTADNIECEIKTYAIHYLTHDYDITAAIDLNNIDSTKMEIVPLIVDGKEVNSVTDIFHAYQNDGTDASGKNFATSEREFKEAVLRPIAAADGSSTSSTIVYFFEITNKLPYSGSVLENIGGQVVYNFTNENNITYEIDILSDMNSTLDTDGTITHPYTYVREYTLAFKVKATDVFQDAELAGDICLNLLRVQPESGGRPPTPMPV